MGSSFVVVTFRIESAVNAEASHEDHKHEHDHHHDHDHHHEHHHHDHDHGHGLYHITQKLLC